MDNFNLINEVVHIEDRLDIENINKINNFIKGIINNSENIIKDNFEEKFKQVEKVSNSHTDSDSYELIDDNDNFFNIRRLYDIFGNTEPINIESSQTRQDTISEFDIEDNRIRDMFESIYKNFIENNTEESKIRSKKSIEDIYNLDDLDEDKSFDDFYKLDFESRDNKKILRKITSKILNVLYTCDTKLKLQIAYKTVHKDDVYTARGWYHKDELLNEKMKKHNLLGTCALCVNNYVFEDIVYFKILPRQKCKINNIQTNNLFCVCKKCYDEKHLSQIINAPKSINEIKLILYCKYGNIYEFNHKLVYEKNIIWNNIDLKNIKEEHDKLVNKLNYYRYMNKNLEEEVAFEKAKHEIVKRMVDKNKELVSNYYYFIHSIEHNNLSNIKTVKKHIEEILDSKIKPSVESIECKICWDKEVSLMLPCGHNICKDCFKKLKPSSEFSDSFNCPHCRALITDKSVRPFFIS